MISRKITTDQNSGYGSRPTESASRVRATDSCFQRSGPSFFLMLRTESGECELRPGRRVAARPSGVTLRRVARAQGSRRRVGHRA